MSLLCWFDHILDSWAEICQNLRWFFGKFKKSKRHSEINWPLGRVSGCRKKNINGNRLSIFIGFPQIFKASYGTAFRYFLAIEKRTNIKNLSLLASPGFSKLPKALRAVDIRTKREERTEKEINDLSLLASPRFSKLPTALFWAWGEQRRRMVLPNFVNIDPYLIFKASCSTKQ